MRWSEIIAEGLAQERVHQDPSFSTIKALTKDATQRFVISKDGDLYVGNAFNFTHQQIFPAMMAVAVRGYFYYKNGQYFFRSMGAFDNVPQDYELLRTFERAGIQEIDPDAEIEESFDKVMAETARVYHGTDATFGNFNDKFRGSSHGNTPTNRAGFHFSDNPEVAQTFGENLLHCDVSLQHPYIVDAKGQTYSDLKHELNDILDKIDRKKYDGIILKNYRDAGKHGGDCLLSNHYIPFHSHQIKVVPQKPARTESFTDKVTKKIKAQIKPDNVTPQRGRSMPGSNPEKRLTRRKRFM
jgi:hypothetical protein